MLVRVDVNQLSREQLQNDSRALQGDRVHNGKIKRNRSSQMSHANQIGMGFAQCTQAKKGRTTATMV